MDDLRSLTGSAARLGAALKERGQTFATAESLTGGLLGALLTALGGASDWYSGGYITYSNEAKKTLLGVSEETLKRWGAVSGQTALEMAQGVRTALRSSWAASVTGVAGPTGGTEEKPLGTVWIGLSGPKGTKTKLFAFPGDRSAVRRATAAAVFAWALEEVCEEGKDG